MTPLVRLRVCSPAGHAPSTGRLAFLLRPVAQRADCARLVPCCASTCRPATSDGGHRSRCGRCWWCRGWSPRSGCFRDRGWAGCARFDGPGCFSTPQLDKRSLGSARDGRFVLSSLFRARARHPTARATRPIRAGGRGREKWRSRVIKVKSRTRALALLVLVRGSARQTAACQNARHRRIFVQ